VGEGGYVEVEAAPPGSAAVLDFPQMNASRNGQVVGRYVLHDEIASGGMATVHIGRILGPAGFSRTVAIKRLHAQYAKDPEFVSMFLDEARIAGRIHHPNVVSTIDVVARDGELFLVMEYVVGESLSRLLSAARQTERVPVPIVVSVIVQALYGLHAAHEAKSNQGEPLAIVHRDVSPQNILVGRDGVARVLDFGVAKASIRLQSTRDGQIKGKLRYMAPEQIQMNAVDRRADVYALSCVLWEALTAEKLFVADDPGAIVNLVLHGTIVPPSMRAPNLPASVDAIVLRGLERNPGARFPTALAMAAELERLGPPATPREVGAWVERTCGDVLEARAARVADIESSNAGDVVARTAPQPDKASSSRKPRPPAPSQLETELENAASPASTPSRPPNGTDVEHTSHGASLVADIPVRPRARWLPASLALIVLGLLLIGALVLRARFGTQPPQVIAASVGTATGAPSESAPVERAPATSPAVEQRATPAVAPVASVQRSGAARRPKKPGCDPPYTNVDGIKTFKPACL
jgi:serine/threonine protein kinase